MIPALYDKFKHWSEKGSVYIISDTHFDDEDCHLMDPHWLPAQEHTDILKRIVHKTDTLIVLGDVGNIEYFKQIKGYKVLLMGNHDTGSTKYKEVFDEVYEGPLMIGEKIFLSHEPIPNINWCLNIHGHDHSNSINDEFHINLASNVCNYIPLNLGKYIKEHGLKNIKSLHRDIIDRATVKKSKGGKK